jgi:hypothetical protein
VGSINRGRVLVGGIVAGIILNVGEFLLNEVVLKEDWEAAAAALGIPAPNDPRAVTVWVVYSLVMGIFAVWLYAAIRPRYGAGPRTALCAASAVWFAVYFMMCLALWNMGLFPLRPLAIAAVWGLFEICIATVAGAWFYREG